MRIRIPYVATLCLFLGFSVNGWSQCSICTKTAQQLGEGPASGMNGGIIYLAFVPLLIIGIIAYKWYRNQKA
ncbi:hypothetical protein ACFS6H_03075 [Terrimonas rubra]|uniref:Uncharacterized protein n=1 Tax=Terrimonas rubra TaxID=1035890 RepID=A0ABW6A3P7_9BACT